VKAFYGLLIGFAGKNRLAKMVKNAVFERVLWFAAVNSHCRHRNMATVNIILSKEGISANLWLICS